MERQMRAEAAETVAKMRRDRADDVESDAILLEGRQQAFHD